MNEAAADGSVHKPGSIESREFVESGLDHAGHPVDLLRFAAC